MSLTLCDVERTNMIGTNAQEKFKMGKIFTDLSEAEYWESVRDILHDRQGSHLKLRSHFSFSQQESVTYLTQWESSHLKTSNNQVHLDLAAANESRPFWDLLWKSWKMSTLFFSLKASLNRFTCKWGLLSLRPHLDEPGQKCVKHFQTL